MNSPNESTQTQSGSPKRAIWPTPGTSGSAGDWLHFSATMVLSFIATLMMLDQQAVSRYAWVAGKVHGGMSVSPVRWFTAHWAHLDLRHFAVNLSVWCVLVCVVPWLQTRRVFWLAVLMSSLTIPLALKVLPFGVLWYVGLSGVLHACFTAMALTIAVQPFAPAWERSVAAGLVMGALIKSAPALLQPLSSSAWLGMATVPIAHLIGAVTGIWVALMVLIWDASSAWSGRPAKTQGVPDYVPPA